MRITESKLRRMIRDVIVESSAIDSKRISESRNRNFQNRSKYRKNRVITEVELRSIIKEELLKEGRFQDLALSAMLIGAGIFGGIQGSNADDFENTDQIFFNKKDKSPMKERIEELLATLNMPPNFAKISEEEKNKFKKFESVTPGSRLADLLNICYDYYLENNENKEQYIESIKPMIAKTLEIGGTISIEALAEIIARSVSDEYNENKEPDSNIKKIIAYYRIHSSDFDNQD